MKPINKLPEEVEGIKQSLENILNADFKIKRKKRTELDIQRDLFFKIVLSLEKLNMRSNVLNIDLDIDLTKYDEVFYDLVDDLLLLHFRKDIAEIVFFYVYDRIDQDGNIIAVVPCGSYYTIEVLQELIQTLTNPAPVTIIQTLT